MSDLSEAVAAELHAMPEAVRATPIASLCLELAVALSAAPVDKKAPLSKELRAALAELRAVAEGAGKRGDLVDEIRDELAERRIAKG